MMLIAAYLRCTERHRGSWSLGSLRLQVSVFIPGTKTSPLAAYWQNGYLSVSWAHDIDLFVNDPICNNKREHNIMTAQE